MAAAQHVLLVVVDALRADHVGCLGGGELTPNVDRLAREGVLFRRAISQSSWTRPATASLMTGLYPSQHGLADRARARARRHRVVELAADALTIAERAGAAGVHTAAFVGGNANLRPIFGITRGFAHFDWHDTTDGAVLVEAVERWLAGDRASRTLAYVHLMDVHNPLPAEPLPRRLDEGVLGLVERTTAELVGVYRDAVRRADEHIAGLVNALGRAGRLDDTLLVVTADHGEELGEHGAYLSHGRTLYPELVHVPLVLRLPRGVAAGTVRDEPAQLVDVLPTVLDALGLPPPNTQGRSLLAPVVERIAFSELVRRDRYVQAATTEAHQLVKTVLFEEPHALTAAELQPGAVVSVKGQPIEDGRLLATKIEVEAETSRRKLRAVVDAVDPGAGWLRAAGVTVELPPDVDVQAFGRTEKPSKLRVGDKVSVSFVEEGGRRRGVRIARRKQGGKTKLVGPVEALRHTADGACALNLLGTEVLVRPGETIDPPRGRRVLRHPGDHLARLLAADVVAETVELLDLNDLAAGDVTVQRPDIAQELEAALAEWTVELARGAGGGSGQVQLDDETLEQLRRMGYVD